MNAHDTLTALAGHSTYLWAETHHGDIKLTAHPGTFSAIPAADRGPLVAAIKANKAEIIALLRGTDDEIVLYHRLLRAVDLLQAHQNAHGIDAGYHRMERMFIALKCRYEELVEQKEKAA